MPAAIGSLTQLAKLLLYKNGISSLPEELRKCIKLQELNLFNNKVNSAAITKAGIGALAGLKEVNFAANKVMQLLTGGRLGLGLAMGVPSPSPNPTPNPNPNPKSLTNR